MRKLLVLTEDIETRDVHEWTQEEIDIIHGHAPHREFETWDVDVELYRRLRAAEQALADARYAFWSDAEFRGCVREVPDDPAS